MADAFQSLKSHCNIITMIDNSEEEDLQDEEDLLIQVAATAAIATGLYAVEHAQQFCDKRCYYDSALLGIAWVLELLIGHPEQIWKELSKHAFNALINTLKVSGCQPSKYVTLEEQLVIFLYTCVTGLLLIHICE